jgi:hypothetical protein
MKPELIESVQHLLWNIEVTFDGEREISSTRRNSDLILPGRTVGIEKKTEVFGE